MIKIRLKKIIYLLFLVNIIVSCADCKEYVSAFSNIDESKKFGYFLKEFKIVDIQSYDNSYEFPIKEVWLEAGLVYSCNSSGSYMKKQKKNKQISFKFNRNNKKLTSSGFTKNWFIKDESSKYITAFFVGEDLDATCLLNQTNVENKQFDIFIKKNSEKEKIFSFKIE